MDTFERMLDLSEKGFYCGQILMLLALEAEDRHNPDLIRAMGGLSGGLGFSGRVCGALTGGCCLIGYYASKGEPEELEDCNCQAMIARLVDWFQGEVGEEYGGIDCDCILGGDVARRLTRCPGIVQSVYQKVMEILDENEAYA